MNSPLGRPPAVPGSPDPLACPFPLWGRPGSNRSGHAAHSAVRGGRALPELTHLKGLLGSIIKQ